MKTPNPDSPRGKYQNPKKPEVKNPTSTPTPKCLPRTRPDPDFCSPTTSLVWNELVGRLAGFRLFYSLGRSQRAGNFDHGFWLIQKLDHSTNLPKNPVILWSNFFTLGSLSYDKFLKFHLFSSDIA